MNNFFTSLNVILKHHQEVHPEIKYFGDSTSTSLDGNFITRCQFCDFEFDSKKEIIEEEKMHPKDFIKKVLKESKGDNLYRARARFRNLSAEELNKEHGESGQTCAEIITGYEEHEKKFDNAIEWLDKVPY